MPMAAVIVAIIVAVITEVATEVVRFAVSLPAQGLMTATCWRASLRTLCTFGVGDEAIVVRVWLRRGRLGI